MLKTNLKAFTNRRQLIALFKQLRVRDPNKPWPLLPVLTVIGPEGSGKRTLFEYLWTTQCCLLDGSPLQPYAYVDFIDPSSILSTLVTLRNQLQLHGNGLTFPRFDLGALIALTNPSEVDALLIEDKDILRKTVLNKLNEGIKFVDAINGMNNELGKIVPYIGLLLAGIKLAGEVPPIRDWVQNLLLKLDRGEAFKWYRSQSDVVGLQDNASETDVLKRLQALSRLTFERTEVLVEDLLPRAFIEDLCVYASDKSASIVLFLNSFEASLDPSGHTGTGLRLLDMLTKQRRIGTHDPLLIVIGSQKHVLGSNDPNKVLPRKEQEGQTVEEYAHAQYEHWSQRLPHDIRGLELGDLSLPLELSPFKLEDTRDYLQRFSDKLVVGDQKVEAIHKVTQGYPLYVKLVAAGLLRGQMRGQELSLDEILKTPVPQTPSLPVVSDMQIGDYLLSLFMKRLPESEQLDLISCAVPRVLDVDSLRVVLELPSDIVARERWNHYRELDFVNTEGRYIVLHGLVRSLLLQKLPSSLDPHSDYYKIHSRLRDHFHSQVAKGNEQAQIEEAYHALALGDLEPAIACALFVQQHNLALWKPFLKALEQAPVAFLPAQLKYQAAHALQQAKQSERMRESVTAVVFYTCLLNMPVKNKHEVVHLHHQLADAYYTLPSWDRQSNLEKAIKYYRLSLSNLSLDSYPRDWSETWNDLGNVYRKLPGGKQINLKEAIDCYESALQERNRETSTREWIETQTALGDTYRLLPEGDWQDNLQSAITCFEAALEVCTPDIFSLEWAQVQHSLGNVYYKWPIGDQQANLKRAIMYYESALEVRSRKQRSTECAKTQNNLGNAYMDLLEGNREANRDKAISYFTSALKVFTPEGFPVEWAMIQYNLGLTYRQMPTGDRQENVQRAINYFGDALQFRTREAYPDKWAMTQDALGVAYWALPCGDRKTNIQKAIECLQAALQVIAFKAYPDLWARMQHNLGNARRDLPGTEAERQSNVEQAIKRYSDTLQQVYTRENFPWDWARIQIDLGIAYWTLPGGDRQANLQSAINCYREALSVCNPRHCCDEWAKAQHHLGNAYRDLPAGERSANLQRAISCYKAALEVRTLEIYPADFAETQNELGTAYCALSTDDIHQDDLQQAVECYQTALQVYQSMHMDCQIQEVSENLKKAQQNWKH